MTDFPLTGGCNCGGVRFEVTEPLVSASWCHCTRCQRRTGRAASPQARAKPGSLRVLQGEDLLRAWEPPDGFAKVFCSACGSSMWSRSPDGTSFAVRFGVFDAIPASARAATSSSPTRRPGSRCPTTGCRASTSAGRRTRRARYPGPMLGPIIKGISIAASPKGRRAISTAVVIARSDQGKKAIAHARKLATSPEGRRLVNQAARTAAKAGKVATGPESRERLMEAARQLRQRKR